MERNDLAKAAREMSGNAELLKIAKAAIVKSLVEYRDGTMSQPFQPAGLVINNPDGGPSSIIRMGPDDAVRIGLRAIAESLEKA